MCSLVFAPRRRRRVTEKLMPLSASHNAIRPSAITISIARFEAAYALLIGA